MLSDILNPDLFASAVRIATPLALAAIGGTICERSGVVNIALEGIMLVGAFFGVVVALASGSVWLGVLASPSRPVWPSRRIHAFASVTLRMDQVVSGTALNILALGLTGFLMEVFYGHPGTTDAVKNTLAPVFDFPAAHGQRPADRLVLDRRRLPQLHADRLLRDRRGDRRPMGHVPDTVGSAAARPRRAPPCRRHRRYPRPGRPLRRGPDLGCAGRACRREPDARAGGVVQRGHDERPRLHRAGREHLRAMDAGRLVSGVSTVRIRGRLADQAARRSRT